MSDNMSTIIEQLACRKIFNGRGEETIEVDVITMGGFGRASAPAGASRGKAEVVPYPEGGVEEAVEIVRETIAPKLVGLCADKVDEIHDILHRIDGTDDLSRIGGNASYAVSLASAEAAASSYGMPVFQYLSGYLANELPFPIGNVLGGGKHALGKTVPDIQEFLCLPLGAKSFFEAAKANVLVHQTVGSLLEEIDPTFTGGRGWEGAWAPNVGNEDALETVKKACEDVSEKQGMECRVCLDMAASTMWDQKKNCYVYARDGIKKSSGEQIDFVMHLIEKYKLAYVEDPFHEEDFESFSELSKKAKGCLICGDDLFATHRKRLGQGIERGAANSIIIKVNQVGTFNDAWKATKMAKDAQYVPVMSHRSGETTDEIISHLALAFGCPLIKTGAVGGTRMAKINELIRIEELLGKRATMATIKL